MEQEREITLIYGKTGMGKSRWTKRYLRKKKRVMVLDPMLEHDGEAFDDMEAMLDRIQEYPTFRVKSEFVQDVPMMARMAMVVNDKRRFQDKKHPELVLAIEESQRSLPSGNRPLPASIEDVIYRGRHARVTLVLISQRPSTVHIAARSQWTRLVVFKQTETADIDWLSEQTGHDPDDFFNLRPGEFWEFTPVGGLRMMLPDQRDATPLSARANKSAIGGGPGGNAETERVDT